MIARISVIPGVSLHFILSAIFISKLVSSSFSHPSQSKSEPRADLFIIMNKAMLTLWSLPIIGLETMGFRISINLLPRMFIDVFYKKYIFRVTLVYYCSISIIILPIPGFLLFWDLFLMLFFLISNVLISTNYKV